MNKRLTALLLAVCLMIGLFGCGKKDEPVQQETETTAAETTEAIVIEEIPGMVYNPEGGSQALEEGIQESENSAGSDFTEPTDAPAKEETEAPTEAPEEPPAAPAEDEKDTPAVVYTEYEKYMNMSGAEQKAFMESFASVEEFFAWLNQVKAEYEALHPEIEVGNGTVDLTKGNG